MTATARIPAPSVRLPVCGERIHLPHHLVQAVLACAAPGTAEPHDVQHHLRCTLQEHTTGDHYALVMDLNTRDTAVWTHWTRGHQPSAVLTLPDCNDTGPAPGYRPCCEFAAHSGAHTFDLTDPFRP
jgi:hypothetical protein